MPSLLKLAHTADNQLYLWAPMSVFLPGKNVGGAAAALEGAHKFQSVVLY